MWVEKLGAHMSLLSKLFGGGSGPAKAEPEIHNGFRIFPEPASEGGGYRIGARIEKDVDGETKVHMMIRADTYQSKDTAIEASLTKAKLLIDQQGDAIF